MQTKYFSSPGKNIWCDFTLATSRFQVFLVNGRVVADRILGAVLREVYAGLLPRARIVPDVPAR